MTALAVSPAQVSATAVTHILVSVPTVTPIPMSAHAVITAPGASLTKPVATFQATELGKTARRLLSTASTALPTAIKQGRRILVLGGLPLGASRGIVFTSFNIVSPLQMVAVHLHLRRPYTA